jgi:hypothetical protein
VPKPAGVVGGLQKLAPRTQEGVRFGSAGWKSFVMENGRTEQEAEQQVARYGKENCFPSLLRNIWMHYR